MKTDFSTFLPNDTSVTYVEVSERAINPKMRVGHKQIKNARRAGRTHYNGACGNEVEDLRKYERIDIGIEIGLMPKKTYE